MYIEASDQKSFIKALESDTRIVVVNVQKFTSIGGVLSKEVVDRLASLRIAFIIDEIHRSQNGKQNEEMISLFDELQSSFDNNTAYKEQQKKKNLIIGFTATPSDHTLARFGEFNKYAEAEKIWVPFDSYTMREAIEDGYILNPIKGIVPVSAKMYFDIPDSDIEGFENDLGYGVPDNTSTGIDENGNKYAIRKKKIYENEDRIQAISKFMVDRLVSTVYYQIRRKAKAMLAVSSIKAAIKYKSHIDRYYSEIVKENKFVQFKDAPVYIVYSENQDYPSSSSLNGGLSEEKVLQNFATCKNGLIIVVDKLQTGFDEPKLHTLFLDKEIKGINAIQTISRVNRTLPPSWKKHDCKIVDFSYKNVNVKNIKKAFEHFSNVVVSDFDPLKDEEKLIEYYLKLKEHDLFKTSFEAFVKYQKNPVDINIILNMENAFVDFINKKPTEAKALKKRVNNYFKILNLIAFVIDIDKKYSEENFLQFWYRYSNEYNNIHKPEDTVDDVEIYFDNRIGIVAPHEPKEDGQKPGKSDGGVESNGKQYKFDILRVIEKRNQEEEEIEALIKEFETQIEKFFAFIKNDENGKRVIAKMKDDGSAFDSEEIYHDFNLVYKRYIRRNKKVLTPFFIRETEFSLQQLCDDFERSLVKVYPTNDQIQLAAES